MSDGGYDDGYAGCSCFWGTSPAELVVRALDHFAVRNRLKALDLGCGEGKNSAAIAKAGLSVTAIDISARALGNGMSSFPDLGICWLECDIRCVSGPKDSYDMVVATGSLHCLDSIEEIAGVVSVMKSMTKQGGLNILSSFNDGPQDFTGHRTSFKPTLVSHQEYLQMYADWNVIESSDVQQPDAHPHNRISHSHSISRILASRPKVRSVS